MLNLLRDPCIRAKTVDGNIETKTLPQVYEDLFRERIVTYPALRVHQEHGWHALLAQLGALACANANETSAPTDASAWEALLRKLAPSPNDHAWHLVGEDDALPAFLQPPMGGHVKDYRKTIRTPDGIDILIASKNHDIKQEVAVRAEPDDWIFALTSVQTCAGYLGKYHYGVVRMNRGFGNRVCVALRPAEGGIGSNLRHDIALMLAAELRDKTERASEGAEAPIALEWLEPWDGVEQIDLRRTAGHFVEICRRLRLRRSLRGGIVALHANAGKRRTNDGDANGAIGDFWTPIHKKEVKALTIGQGGFRYDLLAEVLSPTYSPSPAMETTDTETRWRLTACGICRGEGKTFGYHRRSDIVMGRNLAQALGTAEGLTKVYESATALLQICRHVAWALKTGIAVCQSGGREDDKLSDASKAKAGPALALLDQWTDEWFFRHVEDHYEAEGEQQGVAAVTAFKTKIEARAREILDRTINRIGGARNRRHQARAKAQRAFVRRLRSKMAKPRKPREKEATE